MKQGFRISLRAAGRGDFQGILNCLGEAFAPFRGSYTELAFSRTVLDSHLLAERSLRMQILVAVDCANCVLGTVAFGQVSGIGHIRGMAVLPRYQGLGISSALLTEAETSLTQMRCRSVELGTTRHLQRAIRFYEKCSYQLVGDVGSFFGMDLIRYGKNIQCGKELNDSDACKADVASRQSRNFNDREE